MFIRVALLLLLVSGCGGDPTAEFQVMIESAYESAKADPTLDQVTFGSLEYDVFETNSTIAPLKAVATFNGKGPETEGANAIDSYVYELIYLFENGSWKLDDLNKSFTTGSLSHLPGAAAARSSLSDYFWP